MGEKEIPSKRVGPREVEGLHNSMQGIRENVNKESSGERGKEE